MEEEVKNRDLKNKSIFSKLKESVDDKEEQLEILSTFVRLAILIWSGGILTLAYIKLPPAFGVPEQKLDPTAPSQTIRVEQGPIRFENSETIIKPVPTDPPKPPYSL